jgi:hypothetical protein
MNVLQTKIAAEPSTEVRLVEYEKAAKMACELKSFEEARNLFPDVDLVEMPYVCLDFVFVYTLLVDGLGMDTAFFQCSLALANIYFLITYF